MTNKLDLKQFIGTENYYEGYLNTTWTDGIVYLAKNGCSWIITDICSVIKTVESVKKEPFVAIKLIRKGTDKATAIYTDGNEKELFKQEYKYIDIWDRINEDKLLFFYTNNVLMINSEY